MRTPVVAGVVLAAVAGALAPGISAQDRPASRPAQPAVVLDTASMWRMYHVLQPPVIQQDDGVKPALSAKGWLNEATPEPPAGWTAPQFDDGTWFRGTARCSAQTPCLSRLCLRGRFEVTNPARVKDLQLTLAYCGGAVVHVNGREVARANLPGKAGEPASLAAAYPKEAFQADARGDPKGPAARQRTLAKLAIPADSLRKGGNVLAVEIVRAPYDESVAVKRDPNADKRTQAAQGIPYDLRWNTCEIGEVKLQAASADGLVCNATRPEGLEVWNGDLLTADYTSDFGDRGELLRPVEISGPRNGVESGKLVVGSSRPIAGLRAACSDLRQGESVIPSSCLRIRYAVPWGQCENNRYANSGRVIDALLEAPLGEFPAEKGGAVVPVWVTAQIPKDAKPGAYAGRLSLQADGQKPIQVPLRLNVLDWTLPDTQDWRTWVELIESPDTLVAEYDVPFWSNRHFAMIARAMKYMGELGSRVVYVPLIAQGNFGNEQSMVRWIKKGQDQYEYDFSAMDEYLDAAEKNMGKPKIVCFIAWDVYLTVPKQSASIEVKGKEGTYEWRESSFAKAIQERKGKGPVVTLLDPATGKTEPVLLPRYEEPPAKALWQPLYAELRKQVERRGLSGAMMLGMASDFQPTQEELAVLNDLSGGVPWVSHCHGGSHANRKMRNLATLGSVSYVWDCQYPKDPEKGRTYGWKRPDLTTQYVRFTALNYWPAASLLVLGEMNIAGQQRGVGRIGADYWPAIKDKQGRRAGYVCDRYPQSYYHSLNLGSHLLVPGPNGPVASSRYEVFREGIQQCEARIAIESALTDEDLKAKLGPELAGRCQELLDQRVRDACRAGSLLQPGRADYPSDATTLLGGVAGNAWYVSTGWRQRSAELYSLAGQVARRMERKN